MKYLLVLLGFIGLALAPAPQSNPTTEHLNIGDKAPPISTKDVFGEKFNLKKSLKENDQVLLVFLRHAWCPICNARTHEMLQQYDAIKAKGIEVIVIYQSKKDGLIDYVKDYKLPYKVIADPDCKLYDLYALADDQKAAMNSSNNPTTKELYTNGIKLFGKNKHTKYKKKDDTDRFYMPGDFLVDKNGKITKAYYGKFLGDHWPVKDMLKYHPSTVPAAEATPIIEENKAGINTRF